MVSNQNTELHYADMFPLLFNTVRYSPKDSSHALISDISTRIEEAGTLMVLGPNGAGKSLFLRLAHQLIHPSSGTVSWRDLDSTIRPNNQSMVFQHPIMLNRSVVANLHYALKIKGWNSTAARIQLVLSGLEEFGLLAHAKRDANTLSLGEQQKLAILRAMITKPNVIFLDEPTASLDPSATHQIEQLLSSIATKTKLIMATHNLAQAKRLGDEVLFIDNGKLVEQSSTQTFFTQPSSQIAAQFLAGELLWNEH